MIYKKLIPKQGEIFVDGALKKFDLVNYDSEWTKIRLFHRDIPVSVVSVPTDASIDKPFRTSGHQFKLVRPVDIN
jgi:hypothetical protein